MPTYLSPGVYVEEVPSSIKAIAGVSTSTAGFIGVLPTNPLDMPLSPVINKVVGTGDGTKTVFDLDKDQYPVNTTAGSFEIRMNGGKATTATLTNDDAKKVSQVTLTPAPAAKAEITADYKPLFASPAKVGEPKLCTNFSQFKKFFGDFSTDAKHRQLVHAVYGFFNNGGSRCFVVRVSDVTTDLDGALNALAAIDEIALVAMPGNTDDAVREKLVGHCRSTGDRFAILDGPPTASDLPALTRIKADNNGLMPKATDLAAWYFPWIKVLDPVTKLQDAASDGLLAVAPSGHLAGIYARVDNARGVHKAPANEAIVGALDVSQPLSKADQDGLNPKGVNCLRVLNNNILVWGGRTVGGDANADLKYISVRRTLLFLRESIDEGTQWAVFEPNTPALWQKISRNVSAFLTNVWRSGALFGNTPQEAFYVKCDAETNPPELRELGQVVTEIGVAIVRPAEFVIFRISQVTSASK
jgi:uncharacterized protein